MTNTAVSNGAPSLLPPLVPSSILNGRRLVVVGGTGFLGKVWVAMILHRFPEIEHLYLLVRPKRDQTAEERFWAQIATSPTFDPLREAHPGPAFEEFLKKKVTPVAGDVVMPLLGLDPALVESLKGRVDAVVNVAGVVDFNPPLDEALDVNAFGVNNLVSLAKLVGASVLHTSTCYVAGYRTGLIEEIDPRTIPFPRAEGETWFGAAKPERTLDRSHWDAQREIDECLDLIKQARHRCEDAFRQSHFLDQAKRNLTARGEPNRGTALENELAKVKRKFIEEQLSEAGKERARFWGWPNIYTYTKSIGEQVLAGSGVPFTIVRPAVIESSVEFPFTGWNEGINTSAPIIYIALQGDPFLLGNHDVHLDIIPVDMVASGMIASLCELLEGTAPAVYQYGSSDTNPCRMTRYYELIGLYKRKLVREGKLTSLFDHISSRFEPLGLNLKEYNTFGPHRQADAMNGLSGLLDMAAIGPAKMFFKPVAAALKSAAKQKHKQGDIFDLFLPFICESDYIFSCSNTRGAIARMPLEERARFLWTPEQIDWREWMWDVHLPGLEKHVFPEIEQRLQREVKPLRPYDTLLDLLDEMADKHDHAVALQQVEQDGLTRTSFREWRDASLATAARLAALGVKPGDRVIVSGENQPAWPIAYFGILRAGAVAVPVDPGLDAPRLLNIARSSGARVALWDAEVEESAGREVTRDLPHLKAFDLVLFTEPQGAGEEALEAPPVRVSGEDLASVIYTSGTTGDPKGVMLTHGNFTSLIAALAPLFPLRPSDRVLSVLPLHHTFEFACGLLLPLSRGARIIYVSEVSAEGLSEGLTKGRATALAGVPALWQMLERRIHSRVKEQGPAAAKVFDWALELNRMVGEKSGANLGRLFFGSVHTALGGNIRWLISGGAALPKDTAQFFSGLGLPLAEGYGLTEAAPVLTVAKASMKMKPGHVGKAIPGVEIKIANPDERGVGEVLARGPNVMKGYAGDEAATKRTIDEEGWLHTGDLGKLDKRSQLVIVGRRKEVIVAANGENVYPDDVESMLGKVKGVRELAIVGIDDGKGGERVACLASPDLPPAGEDGEDRPETSAARAERHKRALEALREAIQALPKPCQPAVVHLYDADLPRTATRKVKRSEVKVILTRISSAAAVPAAGGALAGAEAHAGASSVRHAIAAIANRKPAEILSPMSLKADLGFDSLMAMELSVALEAQAGRGLDTVALAKCETVADVEGVVGASVAAADRDDEVIEGGEDEEPIKLPPVVADAAKDLLTRAQMGFYGRVMRPKVYGRAYIPYNRSTIVISNHSSHLDMGFVKYALGSYGEGIVSLAAQDYFFEGGKWRRAYFENLTNLAPFDRKGGLRQAIRQAGEILSQGKTVLIFPEGTRSTDGSIHDFKPVIGHLALTHDVDILPVYLGGTFESWPKGRAVPTRRDIVARIGPPLEIGELRRLTAGMKLSPASRRVTEIAREAVLALKEGKVLDIRRLSSTDAALAPKEHPLVLLFRELSGKFVAGRVSQPVTYYFTLGAEDEAKWSMRIDGSTCEIKNGKPPNGVADCVLKTTPEIFTKIVREAYTPSPMEFMTGAVKSNDISLLQTFQKAFGLG
jgi:long-chain acyl-CoA synthetase